MGSWKPEASADIRGVMATLHNTEFLMDSVIRGHHVYKYIWSSVVGEELECQIETGNVRHFVTKLRKFIFENGSKFLKYSYSKNTRYTVASCIVMYIQFCVLHISFTLFKQLEGLMSILK